MQVILLEKIRNLGNLGDKVDVKPGYGRNYLLPQNKAVSATQENIAMFEKRRKELEKKASELLKKAEERAALFSDVTVIIKAQASDEGKLYGSIGVNEIKDALEAQDQKVLKREIVLPEGPFYAVGDYTVELHLHSDVVAKLAVNIAAA